MVARWPVTRPSGRWSGSLVHPPPLSLSLPSAFGFPRGACFLVSTGRSVRVPGERAGSSPVE
jgi:hypothetical protein